MSAGFDLLSRPLVFIPVTWPGVTEDDNNNAVAIEHSVDIQIEILDRAEFAQWIKDGAVNPDPSDEADNSQELASFKAVAKGWRKIKLGGRVPEFTDENIGRLLSFPGFVNAFGPAYLEAWEGRVKTREGNSGGSAGNGPAAEPTVGTTKAKTSSKRGS